MGSEMCIRDRSKRTTMVNGHGVEVQYAHSSNHPYSVPVQEVQPRSSCEVLWQRRFWDSLQLMRDSVETRQLQSGLPANDTWFRLLPSDNTDTKWIRVMPSPWTATSAFSPVLPQRTTTTATTTTSPEVRSLAFEETAVIDHTGAGASNEEGLFGGY